LLELVAEFTSAGMGYFALQSTKVSTIGLTLYDNPQGFLAYLGQSSPGIEKYWIDTIIVPGEKYVMIQNWANMIEEDNEQFMDGQLSITFAQDLPFIEF
jgi:hypothetical protein